MTTGEKIQYYRKKLGLSQEDLGQKLLVSRQTVSLWENGQTAPTIDNLIRLKEIFDVSVDELLGCEIEKEETENPVECYNVSYSNEELKRIYYCILKLNFKRPLIAMIAFAAIFVMYIFLDAPSAVTALLGGVGGVFAFSLIKSYLINRKAWKNSIEKVSVSKYEYRVYDDFFTVNVKRDNEMVRTERIDFCDIENILDIEEEKYILLNISNRLYILRKNDLASNSVFYKAIYNSKKLPDNKNIKKINTAANVFFVLSLIIIFASILLNNWDTEMNLKAWMFFLPLPVPIISIVIGIIQKKKGVKYKKSIIAGILSVIFLLLFSSFYSWLSDDSHDPVGYLTDVIGIDMPEEEISKSVLSYNYENQPTETGFVFWHTSVEFEELSADKFEQNMIYDSRWLTVVPEELNEALLPIDYDESHKEADKIILYNEFTGEFNTPIESNKFHNFIAVFYFADENRAEIFEYEYDLSQQ